MKLTRDKIKMSIKLIIRSKCPQVSTTTFTKRALFAWEDKRCWQSHYKSLPLGHPDTQVPPLKRRKLNIPPCGNVSDWDSVSFSVVVVLLFSNAYYLLYEDNVYCCLLSWSRPAAGFACISSSQEEHISLVYSDPSPLARGIHLTYVHNPNGTVPVIHCYGTYHSSVFMKSIMSPGVALMLIS